MIFNNVSEPLIKYNSFFNTANIFDIIYYFTSKTQLVKLNLQQALELFLYYIFIQSFDTCFKRQFIQNTFTLTLELQNYDLEVDLRKRRTFSLIKLVASVILYVIYKTQGVPLCTLYF